MSVLDVETKVSSFNSVQKQKLAVLLQRRMAGETIVNFAGATDLSVSWLSKALNLQLDSRPSRRTLHKIISPEVGSINGVSLNELYETCGFEVPDEVGQPDMAAKTEGKADTDAPDAAPISRAKAAYFVDTYMEALRVFLKAWDEHKNAPEIMISRKADNKLFTIMDPDSGFKAICVPVFCQEPSAVEVVEGEILTRMIKAIGIANKSGGIGENYFYFLVDSPEVFEYCCDPEKFPRISSQNIVVLLADEEHRGFIKGCERLSEERTVIELPKLVNESVQDAEAGVISE